MSPSLIRRSRVAPALLLGLICVTPAQAQQQPATPQTRPVTRPAGQPSGQPATTSPAPRTSGATGVASTGIAVPTDYVIGPDDVLGIVFWRDADMTQDVVVRPDGAITLPLIRDIKAAGLTPEQLREAITKAASQYIEDPNVTVVVRQINSRNVFITGQVARPGNYAVSGQMTVLHLISIAGGLTEFANGKNIQILRTEGGKSQAFKFNYNEVADGKKLEQNIVLKPGDQILVK